MAEDSTSPESRRCSTCGTRIPKEAPGGFCPVCLLNPEVVALPPASPPGGTPPTGDGAGSGSDGQRAKDAGGASAPRSRSAPAPAFTVEELRPLFPDLEILDLIGMGGMGAVYRARQPRLDRLVALKVLSCAPEHHENFSLRFEREARLLGKLDHPSIVTIFDFGEIGPDAADGDARSLFWFLMEYVDGTDLGRMIQTEKLAPEQAFPLVPQICDALQHAHDEGITHRDIKPANILVDREGRVKIADFGLARLVGAEADAMMTGLTQTGTSMGTPRYMAPEQWETPEKVDHRADIYSLGVVFYEMLTGERPAGVFDPPSRKIAVDVRIDDVVLKAMEKEPERRYQQAGEMSEEVTRIARDPVSRPASRRVHRRGAAGIRAGLLAGMALLAAAGWWWFGREAGEAGKAERPGATIGDSLEGGRAPQLDVPPELKAMRERGGRLRSWTTVGSRGILGMELAEGIEDFVRLDGMVVSIGPELLRERWLAIRADGVTVTPFSDFDRRGELVSLGADRGVLKTGEILHCWQDERRLVPGDAIDMAVGDDWPYGFKMFLNRDRTLTLFRYGSPVEWRDSDAPEVQARLDPIRDAVQIGGQKDAGIVLRENGEVVSWTTDGHLLLPAPPLRNAVEVACVTSQWFALTSEGKIRHWHRPKAKVDLSPPEDLPPAFALRAHSDVCAAQMADGSWRAWGAERRSELIETINSLGPAVDLRFGGPLGDGMYSLLWIEPVGVTAEVEESTEVEEPEKAPELGADLKTIKITMPKDLPEDEEPEKALKLDVPPELKALRERGGRLRSWTMAFRARDGQLQSLAVEDEEIAGLERAEGIEDFVRLDGLLAPKSSRWEHDRWLAIRSDGPSVTPLPDFERSGELVRLDAGLGVLETGEVLHCWKNERRLIAGTAIDAEFGRRGPHGFGILLNRDRTLTLMSHDAPRPAFFDMRVRLDAINDAVQVEGHDTAGVVLRENGEAISWTVDDRGGLQMLDPPVRNLVEVACVHSQWFGLTSEGKFHHWPRSIAQVGLFPPEDLPPAFALRAVDRVCAVQMADGSWRAWGDDRGSGLIDRINSLGPAVDLLFCSPVRLGSLGPKWKDSLLWIEPVGN